MPSIFATSSLPPDLFWNGVLVGLLVGWMAGLTTRMIVLWMRAASVRHLAWHATPLAREDGSPAICVEFVRAGDGPREGQVVWTRIFSSSLSAMNEILHGDEPDLIEPDNRYKAAIVALHVARAEREAREQALASGWKPPPLLVGVDTDGQIARASPGRLLSLWSIGPERDVVVDVGHLLERPGAWGVVLADLVDHLANAYGSDRAATRAEIEGALRAELARPAGGTPRP